MTKNQKQTEEKKQVLQHSEELPGDAPEDGVGSRLRAAREARGLSQVVVAGRTKKTDPKGQGVSRTVLVGYEAGHSKPGAREIRILCETLGVTPNWLLYGSDAAHEAAQASMEAVRRADFLSAIRLALAISVLKTHERSAFQSLVLSMAGRELGDMQLSALMLMARYVVDPALAALKGEIGEEFNDGSKVDEALDLLVKRYSKGLHTNFANKLNIGTEEEDDFGTVTGQWLYPDPKRKEPESNS